VRHIEKLESGAESMAKVLTPPQATSNANQGKKQRKKQAKREAKMMLQLEQAKKNVQKTEQKLAKTQAQLEAERTHLRDVEAELTKLRHPQQDITHAEVATGDTAQVNEENNIHEFMPSHEVISMPSVEGRMDIPESSETSSSAQETPSDASPSSVETDEAQQDGTGSPQAEATSHTDETGTEADNRYF
jgi:seryl-tRNA synthetase